MIANPVNGYASTGYFLVNNKYSMRLQSIRNLPEVSWLRGKLVQSTSKSEKSRYMQKYLVVLFLFVGQFCFAQYDPAFLGSLDSAIRELQPKGTIYYSDRYPKEHLQIHIDRLKEKKVSELTTVGSDPIMLSRSERKIIIDWLSDPSRNPKELFPDSKRVSEDSILEILGKQNVYFDSAKNSRMLKKAGTSDDFKWGFYFTKPLLIRNGSIAVFCFMHHFGHAGFEGLYMARVINGRFSSWKMLFGYVI